MVAHERPEMLDWNYDEKLEVDIYAPSTPSMASAFMSWLPDLKSLLTLMTYSECKLMGHVVQKITLIGVPGVAAPLINEGVCQNI
jgi:hypothetical protein